MADGERRSIFGTLKWRWLLATLQLLIVLALYVQAFHRFDLSQIQSYQAANPGARIDIGSAVRTSSRLLTRIAYAENFPAVLVAVQLSRIAHFSPLRLGSSYSLDFYDIWYSLSVFLLWYVVGLWLERRLSGKTQRLLSPSRITIIGNMLGLGCSVAFAVFIVTKLASERLILKGQELEIAGLVWALLLIIYFLAAVRPYFSRKTSQNPGLISH